MRNVIISFVMYYQGQINPPPPATTSTRVLRWLQGVVDLSVLDSTAEEHPFLLAGLSLEKIINCETISGVSPTDVVFYLVGHQPALPPNRLKEKLVHLGPK